MENLMKILLILLFMLAAVQPALSQDRIIKTDGTMIEASIMKISIETLEYRLSDNQGPIFELPIAGVHKIILASGDTIEYNPMVKTVNAVQQETALPSRETVGVVAGLNDATEVTTQTQDPPSQVNTTSVQTVNKRGSWRERTSENISFNFDVKNTGSLDSDLFGESVFNVYSELLSYTSTTHVGTLNVENAFLAEHGYVFHTNVRWNSFGATDSETYLLDLGAGYGVNYNSFSFYSTINTTAFAWITASEVNETEFFPSDSEYLRIGVYWKPWLQKRLRTHGDRYSFGFHMAINSYFAGGSGFMMGIAF